MAADELGLGTKSTEVAKGLKVVQDKLSELNTLTDDATKLAALDNMADRIKFQEQKNQIVKQGIKEGVWDAQKSKRDDLIKKEIDDGLLDQRVADEIYRQKKEKQDARDEKAFEKQVKLQQGEIGFRGMIKKMGAGFSEMIEAQKTIGERLSDIGDAFSDDLSFLGDMMSPLSSLPGVNTAMVILKQTGGAVLSLATKEGRARAREALETAKMWVAQKATAVKTHALALKTFIMNKAKIAWDKMIEMKRALGVRATALKTKGSKLMAKLPPKARLLAMFLKSIMAVILGVFVMIAAFGKEILRPVKTFFKLIGTKVSKLFKPFKLPAKLVKVINSVKAFFGPKGAIGKAFGKISDIFAKIGKVIGKFTKGSRIVGMMGSFGKILGKIFWPITALMGAWEAVKGFIAGFKSTEGGFGEKIIGGIYGAMQSLVDFLIMWPLDLIKDLIAWVGEKMGFDMSAMKEFSFSDMWKDISDKFIDGVMAVVRFVKAIAVGIGAGIMALWPGGEGPMEAFKRAFDETMASPGGGKATTIEKPETGTGEEMEEQEAQAFAALKGEEEASWWQFKKKRQQAAAESGNSVVGINVVNEGSEIHQDGTTPEEQTAEATF